MQRRPKTSPEWGSGCPWPGSHHGPCRATRGSSQRLGDMCIVGRFGPDPAPHLLCIAQPGTFHSAPQMGSVGHCDKSRERGQRRGRRGRTRTLSNRQGPGKGVLPGLKQPKKNIAGQ